MPIPKNPPRKQFHKLRDDGRRYKVSPNFHLSNVGSSSVIVTPGADPNIGHPHHPGKLLSAHDLGPSCDIERLIQIGAIHQVSGPELETPEAEAPAGPAADEPGLDVEQREVDAADPDPAPSGPPRVFPATPE